MFDLLFVPFFYAHCFTTLRQFQCKMGCKRKYLFQKLRKYTTRIRITNAINEGSCTLKY